MATEQPTPEQIVAAQKQREVDIREARQILNGEAQFFCERRHLIAVARDAAMAEARTAQLGQVLAALVHDAGQEHNGVDYDQKVQSIRVHADLLQIVKETPIFVAVHPQQDGSVVVEKVMPTVKASASVN